MSRTCLIQNSISILKEKSSYIIRVLIGRKFRFMIFVYKFLNKICFETKVICFPTYNNKVCTFSFLFCRHFAVCFAENHVSLWNYETNGKKRQYNQQKIN